MTAGLRGYVQFSQNTHTHEDQCEWHRMTRMTGPDCAVIMCNLINTLYRILLLEIANPVRGKLLVLIIFFI